MTSLAGLIINPKQELNMSSKTDVVIIGGGPAGLTAALTLARGGRSIIVMDNGKPRNAPAKHMMNFPSREGIPPQEFKKLILRDLSVYKEFRLKKSQVHSVKRTEYGFRINDEIECKKIILAHGVQDILPPIPGMKELWGISLHHCPYCHGHEYKSGAIGLIGNGEYGTHMGAIVKGLSDDLILFTNGDSNINHKLFDKNGIKVYTDKIVELDLHKGFLQAVKLSSGDAVERVSLYIKPEQKLSSLVGVELGCELTEMGLLKVDAMGMTTQTGIYAAGDIMEPRQSVVLACASGMAAAASANYSIMSENFTS